MTRLISLLTISIALIAGAVDWSTIYPTSVSPAVAEYEPVAVVELFTSQGCSSCPPADQLLGKLADTAEEQDQPVYALSFHVAYWNYLGWRDPFSREAFTHRQRQYAQTLGESVYTPQMIVNGTSVFVGSKSATVDATVRQALRKKAAHSVALAAKTVNDSVRVRFKVAGPLDEHVLQIALVERDLSVDVKRGENGGRTLHHDNVVRQFNTIALASREGNVSLSLPEKINVKNASLIAYVQDTKSLTISGASRVALSAK